MSLATMLLSAEIAIIPLETPAETAPSGIDIINEAAIAPAATAPDQDQFVFEDDVQFLVATVGDIQEAVSGSVLTGTTEGDIFLMWDGQEGVTVRAGPGGDIALAWGGSGSLNMGSGADIADVRDWHGTVNLGTDTDGDVLLVGLGEHSGLITVSNFHLNEDALVFLDAVSLEDRAAGLTYSRGDEVVLVLSGVHDEVIV